MSSSASERDPTTQSNPVWALAVKPEGDKLTGYRVKPGNDEKQGDICECIIQE
jgi:hypothetical protein